MKTSIVRMPYDISLHLACAVLQLALWALSSSAVPLFLDSCNILSSCSLFTLLLFVFPLASDIVVPWDFAEIWNEN